MMANEYEKRPVSEYEIGLIAERVAVKHSQSNGWIFVIWVLVMGGLFWWTGGLAEVNKSIERYHSIFQRLDALEKK